MDQDEVQTPHHILNTTLRPLYVKSVQYVIVPLKSVQEHLLLCHLCVYVIVHTYV